MIIRHDKKMSSVRVPSLDIEFILSSLDRESDSLSGKNILVTGATGFIGKWIIETLINIRNIKKIKLEISVLSRNMNYRNYLEHLGINFILGDIVDFSLPKTTFDFIIHGAAPTVLSKGGHDQNNVKRIIINGTQNLLDQISYQDSKANFLFLSSGAVYGKSNLDLPFLESSIDLNKPSFRTLYGDGKLIAENLIQSATESNIISGCSPRLFGFSGPHLSLNEHFAFGNFVFNALRSEPFLVRGNPLTQRSYLHVSELVIWIFKSLLSPTVLPINFGSDEPVSIKDLAQIFSDLTTKKPLIFADNNSILAPSYYYPNTARAKQLYNVRQEITLEQQIIKFYNWARGNVNY